MIKPNTIHPSSGVCRDCFSHIPPDHSKKRCSHCGGSRVIAHPDLFCLSVAHVDCDAFYASVEKRDNPDLKSKALIVGGGGTRGVVATCCYIARMKGVKSAMPMFKARKLCPEAIIIKPDMAKYREISRKINALYNNMTPEVEPLALDEAFLGLSGTKTLTGLSPAEQLIRLAKIIEDDLGITVSIGLSYNKFLAKLASDREKPRGFTLIGQAETLSYLAPLSIGKCPGIGPKSLNLLKKSGFITFGQVQGSDKNMLIKQYGEIGLRLYDLARGQDTRKIEPNRAAKSISAETTLTKDLSTLTDLERIMLAQCDRVSHSLKNKKISGTTVVLKLKTNHHKQITRSRTLANPTQLSHVLFETGCSLMAPLVDGTFYRLVGIGVSNLEKQPEGSIQEVLFDDQYARKTSTEYAIDILREKFGSQAVIKGRQYRPLKNQD